MYFLKNIALSKRFLLGREDVFPFGCPLERDIVRLLYFGEREYLPAPRIITLLEQNNAVYPSQDVRKLLDLNTDYLLFRKRPAPQEPEYKTLVSPQFYEGYGGPYHPSPSLMGTIVPFSDDKIDLSQHLEWFFNVRLPGDGPFEPFTPLYYAAHLCLDHPALLRDPSALFSQVAAWAAADAAVMESYLSVKLQAYWRQYVKRQHRAQMLKGSHSGQTKQCLLFNDSDPCPIGTMEFLKRITKLSRESRNVQQAEKLLWANP